MSNITLRKQYKDRDDINTAGSKLHARTFPDGDALQVHGHAGDFSEVVVEYSGHDDDSHEFLPYKHGNCNRRRANCFRAPLCST